MRGHEVLTEADLGHEADGVQRAVDATPRLGQMVTHGLDMGGLGDVEFEHLDLAVEFAGRALGEAQRSARAGQDDLGAFVQGQLGDSERERCVGEHTGDQDAFSIEQTHGFLRERRERPDATGGFAARVVYRTDGGPTTFVARVGSAPVMTVHLYDTARRAVVPFEPGPIVTMYTCGITPYDATHLGHASVYVGYDVLQRRLRDLGHETRCVRNVTDVDDDILRKARELGMHYLDLAAAEMARFDDDMRALGMLDSWSEPRATSAIADIRRFIGDVLDRGHAYQSGGAVYFDVGSFPGFGDISGYDRDTMVALAAERGGNPDDPAKRDPLDFVLWQPSATDEPAWDSAWGPGRPGWHIECSTLAMRELDSATIDLHGGGADLIFPHHECERAQSEAATGEPFVRHWMHQAMVRMDGEKMSKSLGNLVFVSDLRSIHDPACHPTRHRGPSLPRLLGVERHDHADRGCAPRTLDRGRYGRWRDSTRSGPVSMTISTRRGPSRRSTTRRRRARVCPRRRRCWASTRRRRWRSILPTRRWSRGGRGSERSIVR